MSLRPTLLAIHVIALGTGLPGASSAQSTDGGQEPSDPPARARGEQISEYVREVFQDRDGVFWFGTNGDGVCRWDGASLTYLSVEQGFGGRAVRGILQDPGGALWFATEGGVSRYESGAFTNYTTANGLSDDSVWSLMLDSSGTLWVGTHGGVCRFDGESFAPFPLPRVAVEAPASRFSPLVVFAMLEDRAGDLWFGTDGEGAHRFDGESFTTFTTGEGPMVHDLLLQGTVQAVPDSVGGLAGNQVRCIQGDRQGRVWIGTDGGGVSCYDGATLRTFTAQDGLENDRVFEILEDSAGNLWFSTLGAGACRYDGTSFTAFGVDQGLIVNELPCPCGSRKEYGSCHGPGGGHVQEIFEDRDGVLWFGCSGGLFRLEGDAFVNVTRDGPWPAPGRAPVEAADPLAAFARMTEGAWRVTFESGTSQLDTWSWGPGRHSLRRETDGFGAPGEPWRALEVVYWHPGREQVRLLGLSPFARSVSEGTLSWQGERVDAVFELHQTSGPRELERRWVFDGPDRYHMGLWEATGGGRATLVELDYVRTTALEASDPGPGAAAPRPSEHLAPLNALLASTWEAAGELATGPAFHIRSTFEWVPYADYVHARSIALAPDGEPTHLLDAYVYYHPGAEALRCLALSSQGGVYEGDVSALEGGGLQLDLEGYEGDRVVPRVVRFDLEPDGTLRNRVWSLQGAERTLLLDVRHRALEPQER